MCPRLYNPPLQYWQDIKESSHFPKLHIWPSLPLDLHWYQSISYSTMLLQSQRKTITRCPCTRTVRTPKQIWKISHIWWYTNTSFGLFPIVEIVMSPPAMNTCSKKCQLPHPTDQLEDQPLLLDTQNIFTLPNMLDNHTFVHIIQRDTCLYDIQDLEPEDITERMRIKKKQATWRRMRRMRQAAEIQVEKVKWLKRELWLMHKWSKTESGEMGIIWWNREYWGTGFGARRFKVKKEEPLTLVIPPKVELPPTSQLTYPTSCTSTSRLHSIDPSDFEWSPVYTPSPF